MNEYIRVRLAAIKSGMPADDQITIMQDIYEELEELGYSSRSIKDMIDSVIRDNIFKLKRRLNEELEGIRSTYTKFLKAS